LKRAQRISRRQAEYPEGQGTGQALHISSGRIIFASIIPEAWLRFSTASLIANKPYIESVTGFRLIVMGVCALSLGRAGEPQPATLAAFDRYVMLVEEQNKTRVGPHNFLWIDQHPDQKSRAWFSQDVLEPLKTLDHGNEIAVPDGLIQDWVGAVFLENATLERVRDVILGFANYKTVFKQQIADSRLVKRDGDHYDAFLRIYRRQVEAVVLNANISSDYTLVDPNRGYVICRSTHIGEALHNKKSASEEERSPQDEYGYLWRMNLYWRLEYADNGIYAELELISLSHQPGGRISRLLNGFVEDFPRGFVAGFMDGLRLAFPNTR